MSEPIERKIIYDVDQTSINNAKKKLHELKQAEADLNSEFLKGEKPLKEYKKELSSVQAEAKALDGVLKKLDKSADALGDELKDAADNADALGDELEDVAKSAKKADGAVEDIDTTPPNPNVEPSTGKSNSLSSAGRFLYQLPSQQLGGGISTDVIGRVSNSLGGLGVSASQLAAIAPVAAVAVGGVALAFSEFNRQAQEQIQVLNAVVAGRRAANQAERENITTSEAQERIALLEKERDQEQSLLDDAREAWFNFIEDTAEKTAYTSVIPQIVFGEREQELADDASEASANVTNLNAEIAGLNRLIEDGITAANDAAEAEERLAAARTKAVLESAQAAAELVSVQQQADTANADQLEALITTNRNRREVLQAELNALKASGDTSEQVAQQIAQLEGQIKNLGDQAQILSAEQPEAQARTDAAEAEKELEQALREHESAAKQAAQAEQSYSNKLRDIDTKVGDKRIDIEIDKRRKLEDVQLKADSDEQKSVRDKYNDLAKIRKEADRDELEAVRGRNFAALRDARENEAQGVADRLEEFRIEGEERLLEIRDQGAKILLEEKRKGEDLRRETSRQRRDAYQDLQDFYNNRNTIENQALESSLKSVKTWSAEFKRAIEDALSSASRSSISNSSYGSSSSFDDLAAVFGGAS